MNRPRPKAQVFASAAARDEALWRMTAKAPGGLLEPPPVFTSEELLARLVDRLELPAGHSALSPLAGAMLVQGLLRSSDELMHSYPGLAAVWRLPARLWRLIMEVKAAGLDQARLRRLPGQGIQSLAMLMDLYERELKQRCLLDQADRLALLEKTLAQGRSPLAMAGWGGVEVRQVVWLRALDLCLLRAISRNLLVSVNLFMVPPAEGMLSPLARLLEKTCSALEGDPDESIEVRWLDLAQEGGPLSGLAAWFMSPGAKLNVPSGRLRLHRHPGRYGEVEAMVRRALQALDQGVAPHDIALVFPELELYGQMTKDVAGRLGLPLAGGGTRPLNRTLLVRDFLALLRLPLSAHVREDLAQVLESPYWSGPLSRLAGVAAPRGVSRLLALAGYVDQRERPALSRLAAAAQSGTARAGEFKALAKVVGALEGLLARHKLDGRDRTISGMAGSLKQLLQECRLGEWLLQMPPAAGFASTVAADIKSLEQLTDYIDQFAMAATQAGTGQRASLGRQLAMLEDYLGQGTVALSQPHAHGVRLLRLDQALGLPSQVLLVGGLNQGEFPRRPAGQNLLTADERFTLGRNSPLGLPVWRVDSEEYAGQMLSLLWLLGWCQGQAELSTCAADSSGREIEPSNFLISLSHGLEDGLEQHRGGVYGQTPDLHECLDRASLRTRLSSELLRPGSRHASLAQAVLHHWCQDPAEAVRWQGIAARAAVERQRNALNLIDNTQRSQQAGEYDGALVAPIGLARLGQALRQGHRTWSPTGLELYAQCPMRWFFRYMLRIAEVEAPGWDPAPHGEGRWVHETLRMFFDPDEFNPAWNEEEQRERLRYCLDQALAVLAAQGAAGHPQVWQARQGELLGALGAVIDREMQDMGDMRPIGVEQELAKGLKVSCQDGEELTLSGRLDRLDQGQGRLRVTDYKHTRDSSGLRDAVNPELIASQAFQVPVYLAGAAHLFGAPEHGLQARLVSTLKPRQKVYEYDTQDPAEQEASLFKAIDDIWRRLNQGDFVAAPSEQACKWCEVGLLCRSQAAPLEEDA